MAYQQWQQLQLTGHPMTPEANAALSKAKLQLMSSPEAVFFSVVMLSLQHIWDETQPTAYTNGRLCGYNPSFFMRCTPRERVGLILHETLHVALLHICRALSFDSPMKFNMAADYVINLIIIDAGFELPPGALIDEQYRDMSVEEVYALLPDDPAGPDMMWDLRPATPEEVREFLNVWMISREKPYFELKSGAILFMEEKETE
jgi:hypothetical protein